MLNFQLAGVNKPLAAASAVADAGYEIVLNSRTGSYLRDLDSGMKEPIHRENGVYILEVLVVPPDTQSSAPFVRQG